MVPRTRFGTRRRVTGHSDRSGAAIVRRPAIAVAGTVALIACLAAAILTGSASPPSSDPVPTRSTTASPATAPPTGSAAIWSEGLDNVIADNDISDIAFGHDDVDAIRFFGSTTAEVTICTSV